jgi:hypothetical protein
VNTELVERVRERVAAGRPIRRSGPKPANGFASNAIALRVFIFIFG